MANENIFWQKLPTGNHQIKRREEPEKLIHLWSIHETNKMPVSPVFLFLSFSLSLFLLLFQICKPTHKISGDQIKLISIINSVDSTKLPCYTLPPMQHQSFFRNLPSLFIYLLVQYVSGVRKKLISGKLSTCTLEYPECHGIRYAVAFEHIM